MCMAVLAFHALMDEPVSIMPLRRQERSVPVSLLFSCFQLAPICIVSIGTDCQFIFGGKTFHFMPSDAWKYSDGTFEYRVSLCAIEMVCGHMICQEDLQYGGLFDLGDAPVLS